MIDLLPQPKSTTEFVNELKLPKIKFISTDLIRTMLQEYTMQYGIFYRSREKYKKIKDPTKIDDPIYNFALGYTSGMRDILEKLELHNVLEAVIKNIIDNQIYLEMQKPLPKKK